jgi:hypothetical protein
MLLEQGSPSVRYIAKEVLLLLQGSVGEALQRSGDGNAGKQRSAASWSWLRWQLI